MFQLIPGLQDIFRTASPLKTGPGTAIPDATLGGVLSSLFNIILLISGFLMFFWLTWGVFQYIFAGGNKEALAKAISRMIWVFVGFIIILLSFAIKDYLFEVVAPQTPPIKTMTAPQ